MSDYLLTETDTVVRLADHANIPNDPENIDRQAFDAWIAAGNTPGPYIVPAAAVPPAISDRQFFQQLALQGIVSQDDALAAVRTGVIPAALQQLINGLPADEQFGATMIVAGATTFERWHPLTIAIATAYGWSSDQLDTFFRAAAVL
ncbi:hypothetical protein G8O24_03110 [Bradyrhizobium sp. INPA01-394B]|uniref:Uncharacterized protein n=1 Tax=Bradyrhizobium campsiandrae TaxID=1729892 RepID=A0ABR7U9P1_9BRAD|nr:hypothetical protein [Bradyrhizobium campsiandrae]MBC9876335.1 hypothetical protein [Bradyrhizobium campsiandrae]MBC9980142.1 hypothetical protein [Bradyrhizobium campsiandrae]